MIEIGKNQILKIKNFASHGAYLYADSDMENTVLLPKLEVPKGKEVGDEISVFVYKDSSDRTISTTKKPYIEIGKIALLRVVSKTKIGAFMDMGLERDVLLPFSEMIGQVAEGKSYLVRLYVDKSERLAVSMNIRQALETKSNYKENDSVMGTIYSMHPNHGLFVAVDEKYDSLVPKDEAQGIYEIGEVIQGRVSQVNKDGRLVLSLKERAYLNIGEDSEIILDLLEDNNGVLNIGDKSSPEEIKEITGMTKSAFKKAVGQLYKERSIKIQPKKIELV